VSAFVFYTAAAVAGTVAGLAFAIIWLKIVPMPVHGRFWTAMAACSREILTVDDTSRFLQLYRQLGKLVGGYTVRNLAGVLISVIPVILLWVASQALLFTPWEVRAHRLVVVPAAAGSLEAGSRTDESQWDLRVAGSDTDLLVSGPAPRAAACWTSIRCGVFAMLGFEVTRLPAPPDADLSAVVVRADSGAWNPLWPYLGGLEFVFTVALVLSMTIAMVRGMKTT
jgi:hypothetical protein